ncbi:MAG: MarR family transcriptional regulator [Thiobacillus sp.]
MEVAKDTPSATTILNFLSAHDGRHTKADILATNGITDGQWNAAIAGLIAGGMIESRGEMRGTRYQAVSTGEEK